MQTDIVVVGAGPAGLSFLRAMKGSGLRIAIVERSPLPSIASPSYDGREIALTHASQDTMQRLGMWEQIPSDEIYPLKDAKVVSGMSDYTLHFPQPKMKDSLYGEQLGFLISNHNIRQAAFNVAQEVEGVEWITDTGVQDIQVSDTGAMVYLDNGDVILTHLVVAADSRFSQTRRQLGISANSHDYGRTVLAFRVKHEKSNEHTAFECFHYGRSLALLPLDEYMTNCVVTADHPIARQLLNLSHEELAQDIASRLNLRLGNMQIVSDIHQYPLVGVHANHFQAKRGVLIGDAAVGMHPVTAHGFNLGLESASRLAALLHQSLANGQDIANSALLKKYEMQHMLHTRPLYHGTHAMVSLFTNDAAPAKLLRHAVLRISNHLPPVKKLIAMQLTGKWAS